jgi:U3 small nucleolar RNA-associated protein 16
MVTTRGGTETPGAPTPTPVRSSTRKTAGKRELEPLETPTQAKRQRKTAPISSQKKKVIREAKEPDVPSEELSQDSVEAADPVAVAAPSDEPPQTPANDGKMALRRKSKPQVVIPRTSPDVSTATDSFGESNEAEIQVPTQSSDFQTPMQAPGSIYATPATSWKPRDNEGSPTTKAAAAKEQTPASSSAKKGRGRPKKTPNKGESSSQLPSQTPSKFADVDEIPSSSYQSNAAPIQDQEWVPQSAQPEKTHRRFGSEEPAETQTSPIANRQGSQHYEVPQTTNVEPAVEAANDDDDATDSDDEAPEVVTTAAASSKTQAAQAEADRAQKAQQAKEEAKRQAREELVAAQQAAKREREEKKAKKLARKAAREQKAAAGSFAEEQEPNVDIDVNGLLPASLLENIDDQRPPTPPPTRGGRSEEEVRKEKLNHHIKFLERTDKGPKDVKKGKLSVAVLARQNRVLPPKVNRQTKNVREHWLKGRQHQERKMSGKGKTKVGRVERRAFGNQGFLRNWEE